MRLKSHALLATLLTAALMSACQPQTNDATTPESSESQAPQAHNDTHTEEHGNNVTTDAATDSANKAPTNNGMDATLTSDANTAFQQEYHKQMMTMHSAMMAGMSANDADVAFAKGMLAHHQGAVAMAKTQLKYGQDKTMNKLAQDVIDAQQGEIEQMQNWLAAHPDTASQPNTQAMQQAYKQSMVSMDSDMMTGIQASDADMAFAKGMLAHHQSAVAMAKVQLEYGQDSEMNKLAQDIIDTQQDEIELMQNWISEHSA